MKTITITLTEDQAKELKRLVIDETLRLQVLKIERITGLYDSNISFMRRLKTKLS